MSEPSEREPAPSKTIVLSLPMTEKAGDRIGHFKLLQQIGEGGCGVVYMAEQEQPVRRRVALKVIKLGMDTKSVIARFEAERQALALMDHPNIAKVLDAGATDNGRPFFVMELVRGIKITEYCDQNNLSTKDRLALFIQVCHAIQHAHQKGIIHRDIKPSNILVTLHDGVPVPKVIDFGIAKATQGRLTDQTLFTAFEQFIGTPAYMSPEQAEMSGLDIDTRSDIYALGVLLYELLTGKTPFDAKELLASGLDKLRETIREKEPERPSTRLSTMLAADQTTTAKHHRTEAPKLIHLLRGDLDWIVMKALEKDRTRRYETANGLAMDVQRYLNNDLVLARPPSNLYRFQKLVRRNKATFAATAAVILALLLGLALVTVLLLGEMEERARAEIGMQYAQAGLLISQGQPDQAEALVNSLPRYPGAAALYLPLGTIHGSHGQFASALSNLTMVVELAPSNHMGYHYLAPLLAHKGEVEGYNRLRQQILKQFKDTPDPVTAERMAKVALILPPSAGELDIIRKWADTAIGAGDRHRSWDYFQFVKGLADYRQGRFAEAEPRLQKVVAVDDDSNRTTEAYAALAMAQYQQNKIDEAKSTLLRGEELEMKLPKLGHGKIGEEWNDWIIAHLLMQEAKDLIEGAATPKGGKK